MQILSSEQWVVNKKEKNTNKKAKEKKSQGIPLQEKTEEKEKYSNVQKKSDFRIKLSCLHILFQKF